MIKIDSINPPSEFGWPAAPGEDTATTNYSVQCTGAQPSEVDGSQCTESFCLFNLADDPCEYNDLAAQYPKKVAELTAILDSFQPSAVESGTSGPCSPVEIIFEDTNFMLGIEYYSYATYLELQSLRFIYCRNWVDLRWYRSSSQMVRNIVY